MSNSLSMPTKQGRGWPHFWLFIFTYGIGNVVYLIRSKIHFDRTVRESIELIEMKIEGEVLPLTAWWNSQVEFKHLEAVPIHVLFDKVCQLYGSKFGYLIDNGNSDVIGTDFDFLTEDKFNKLFAELKGALESESSKGMSAAAATAALLGGAALGYMAVKKR